jgi:hypothetical protein
MFMVMGYEGLRYGYMPSGRALLGKLEELDLHQNDAGYAPHRIMPKGSTF